MKQQSEITDNTNSVGFAIKVSEHTKNNDSHNKNNLPLNYQKNIKIGQTFITYEATFEITDILKQREIIQAKPSLCVCVCVCVTLYVSFERWCKTTQQ